MKRVFYILTVMVFSVGFSFAQETFSFPATGTASITISIPTESWTINNTNGLFEFILQ